MAIYRQLRRLLAAWITSGWPTIHPEHLSALLRSAQSFLQTPATPSGYSRFDTTNELVLRFPSSVRRSDAASLTIQDDDIRLISVHKFAKGEMKEALLPPTFRRSTPGVFNYFAAD